jgi:plasmid stabilization system protein ParE
MKVELNSLVHIDLLEIVEYYYESDKASLAAEFYEEFRRCVDQVVERPESFPVHIKNFRRVNLKRFPHHFLFRRVDENVVRILTVKHNSRDPRYGLDRT